MDHFVTLLTDLAEAVRRDTIQDVTAWISKDVGVGEVIKRRVEPGKPTVRIVASKDMFINQLKHACTDNTHI